MSRGALDDRSALRAGFPGALLRLGEEGYRVEVSGTVDLSSMVATFADDPSGDGSGGGWVRTS